MENNIQKSIPKMMTDAGDVICPLCGSLVPDKYTNATKSYRDHIRDYHRISAPAWAKITINVEGYPPLMFPFDKTDI